MAVVEIQSADELQTAVGSEAGVVRGSSIPARKQSEILVVDSFTRTKLA